MYENPELGVRNHGNGQTSAPGPSPVVGRYLRGPGRETAHLLHELARLISRPALHVGAAAVVVAMITVFVLVAARRAQGRRAARHARAVEVLSPPEVDPAGAEQLWSNLVALLRPAWHRLLGAQPHVGFEVTAGSAGLRISFWVPGVVPPGLVERAVEAAWPGARTSTGPASPPLPGGAHATSGVLRLAGPGHYSLRAAHKADPPLALLRRRVEGSVMILQATHVEW